MHVHNTTFNQHINWTSHRTPTQCYCNMNTLCMPHTQHVTLQILWGFHPWLQIYRSHIYQTKVSYTESTWSRFNTYDLATHLPTHSHNSWQTCSDVQKNNYDFIMAVKWGGGGILSRLRCFSLVNQTLFHSAGCIIDHQQCRWSVIHPALWKRVWLTRQGVLCPTKN